MEINEFEILQKKLDELNAIIAKNHQEHFDWANSIFQNQMHLVQSLNEEKVPKNFIPHYNYSMPISPAYPEIFNKYGERMEVFFISDKGFSHAPNSEISRYIIWDRYNYGLETHFYTYYDIFKTVGKPKRKFAMISEPPSILPQCYKKILKNKNYVEENFDAVFTHDTMLLANLKNAEFAPLSATVWYGRNMEGNMTEGASAGFSNNGNVKQDNKNSAENYKRKTKGISMIASAKEMCPMHIFRKQLAFKCKTLPNVDTYGKFDGGDYVSRELPFEEYRYSIAVENYISPFYFTEKILDCFMAQTVPIYIGATEIGEFFNLDGIIQITVKDCKHIEDILTKCTSEEYERRLPAIIDNFNRVQHFANQTRWDDIYLNYIKQKN